jgi:hypothetical protein
LNITSIIFNDLTHEIGRRLRIYARAFALAASRPPDTSSALFLLLGIGFADGFVRRKEASDGRQALVILTSRIGRHFRYVLDFSEVVGA